VRYALLLENNMEIKCPHCGSNDVRVIPQAKQSGSTIGSIAGAAFGLSGLVRGARTGMTVGAIAGPAGVLAGGVGGALLSAFMGGSAGYALGGAIGDQVDKRMLRNHVCDECGALFKPGDKPART
jgi:ribosomal protein L40E